MSTARKIAPLAIGLLLFIVISALVQWKLDAIEATLQETTRSWGMALYVLVGISTVIIPFASLMPFMPIAVALWGWPVTALLSILAWTIGGQLIFELSRALGKPFVERHLSQSQLDNIRSVMQGKGVLRAIMIRTVFHGDIVSFAFALLTRISRWEFLLITAVGVTPSAFAYAYFGSLPLALQAGLAGAVLVCAAVYWTVKERRKA